MENTPTPCADAQTARVIDLTSDGIPADDLAIALRNAALDPDGQVYPWRDGYPLCGGTVVYDGRLWTVSSKEPGPSHSGALIHLDGQGHGGRAIAAAYECRPVTWTALDEIELEVTLATSRGGVS